MASFETTLRNNMLDEITSRLGASCEIKVYDGTPPADVGTALSGNTLLAQGAGNATAFAAAASAGVLTANAMTSDTSADATGTPSFARFAITAGGADIIQVTVGTSGTELIIDSATITAGQEVQFTSLTITAGNA